MRGVKRQGELAIAVKPRVLRGVESVSGGRREKCIGIERSNVRVSGRGVTECMKG